MPDFKYAKFCINTYCKLLIFLVLCFVAYTGLGFAPSPVSFIGAPVVLILLHWLFLTYIEEGKRSFLSKGYMVENIVPGALCGLLPVAAVIILVLTGHAGFGGINSSFDLTASFLYVVKTGFFISLALFGYFFHIICQDFGSIAAVIITSILYTAAELFLFGNFTTASFINIASDGSVSSSMLIYVINIALTGAAAGLLILNLGDMRSAAAFISVSTLCRVSVCGAGNLTPLFRMSGDGDFSGSIIFTFILLILVVINIISYNKSN